MSIRMPQRSTRRSDRGPTRLKVLIAALALSLVTGLWLAVIQRMQFERSRAISSAVEQNQARTRAFEQYVLRTLDVGHLALNHTIAVHAEKVAIAPPSPVPLNDPTLDIAAFAAVTIQIGDRVIATSRAPAPVLPQPVVDAANNTRAVKVSRPIWLPDQKRSLIAMTKMFDFGRRSGLVAVWIEPRLFTDFSDGATYASNDLISLIGLDGITRARRTGSRLSSGEDLSGKLVMRMQARQPNGTYLGPSSINQIPHYFSHRRLPGYALFVTSGISIADVLMPLEKRQEVYVLELLATTLAILVGTWVLIDAIDRRFRQMTLLANANRRLIEAQRIASTGDWEYDFSSGQLHWSRTLCEMYGRQPGEAISSLDDIGRYVDEENSQKLRAAFARICATGDSESYDLVVRLPGDVSAVRRIVAVASLNAAGAVIGVHGTDQDISERRRLETLEAQLSNVARTDAMNALAATLAHELNQPLAAAANYLAAASRLLRAERVDISLCAEIIASAAQQIHDTGDIVRGARELVTKAPARLSTTSLKAALEESISLLKGLDGAEIVRIQRVLDPACDAVMARSTQIRQVFFNLLKNALEAGGAGDSPRITVTSSREDEEFVRVVVSDNGRGFNQRNQDPFSALGTTKIAGLGLGLSLSRTILEAHGGKIWIERTGTEGTSVGFTLRAAIDDLPQLSASPAETPT